MNDTKLVKIFAHSFFLVLFVYAAWFYVERILYVDGSFYLFKILAFEKFNIEAGRRMAFLTQVIPLAFIKMHAGLKMVMLSYSVSFVIVYYLVFLASMHLFSSLRAAIAGTLVLFLGISDTTFYPFTELQLGMMFCILLYALLEYYFDQENVLTVFKKALLLAAGAAIILACRFSHPATLFPMMFVLGFEFIDKKLYRNKAIYGLVLFAAILFGLKYMSVDKNSYEGQEMAPLHNLAAVLKNFLHSNSLHFFLKFVLKGVYIFPILLFLVTAVFYAWKKNFLKLFFLFAATGGFFLLLMIIFSPGDSDAGMEKNMIPLWIFVAIPFVHDVLLRKSWNSYLRPFLYGVIVVSGLAGFYRATLIYSDRIVYMREILETASESSHSRKIIMEKKDLNLDRLAGNWSFANETLLLSSIEGPQFSKTIYLVDNLEQLKNIDLQKNDVFLCVQFWPEWNYSDLNKRYFGLPLEPYTILEGQVQGK